MTEFPTWQCVVAGALRGSDGRWLMHRRPLHKHHGGLWEFPGGKVEPAEIPRLALARELLEELGISVEAARLVPAGFAETADPAGPHPIVILLYIVPAWKGEATALDAGAKCGWFTSAEIRALKRPPLDIALCDDLFGRGENAARR